MRACRKFVFCNRPKARSAVPRTVRRGDRRPFKRKKINKGLSQICFLQQAPLANLTACNKIPLGNVIRGSHAAAVANFDKLVENAGRFRI